MAMLGNLTARILLPLWRMSTVKIRTGSLFCNRQARIGAWEAEFHRSGPFDPATWPQATAMPSGKRFPPLSTRLDAGSQDVHRRRGFETCVKGMVRCKVKTKSLCFEKGFR